MALEMDKLGRTPGDYDIEFIGDSITQGWEGAGSNVWHEYYGGRKVINFGVGGFEGLLAAAFAAHDDEAARGSVVLRNLESKVQEELPLTGLSAILKSRTSSS